MTLHLVDAYQHLKTKGPVLFALIKFILVASFPHPALAFEATLPNATAAKFIAPIQLANKLPAYDYTRTGTTVAYAEPITKTGDWPVEVSAPTKLAALPTVPTPPVASGQPLVLEGEASFYSRAGCLGCDPAMIMANGQPLNDNALTMAIGANLKQYVGYHARVTSLATGKSVVAKITDTGGFYQAKYGHRVADLTIATKTAIGMPGGVGQVRVEVLR